MIDLKALIRFFETEFNIYEMLSFNYLEKYSDKKLSVVMDFDNDPIISIEILTNGTCDMYIVDFETEETKYFITKDYGHIEEVKQGIIDFLTHCDVLK